MSSKSHVVFVLCVWLLCFKRPSINLIYFSVFSLDLIVIWYTKCVARVYLYISIEI